VKALGMIWAAVAIALVVALSACNPYLTAQSVAPPGRAARLDEVTNFWGVIKRYRMELSEGVAMAVSCYYAGPCEHLEVTSHDPAIAEVRPASFGVLQPAGVFNAQTTSAIVVVGRAPGTTTLHVKAKQGERDVLVTVVAPPSPMQKAALAAHAR
jgi:hypothetical protein